MIKLEQISVQLRKLESKGENPEIKFFLFRLMERKSFFYAYYFNWSLTSLVILDTHGTVEPSQSCNLTEIMVYQYSAHRKDRTEQSV